MPLNGSTQNQLWSTVALTMPPQKHTQTEFDQAFKPKYQFTENTRHERTLGKWNQPKSNYGNKTQQMAQCLQQVD